MAINILRDIQIEKQPKKALFIKIIFGSEDVLEYNLVDKKILGKINAYISKKEGGNFKAGGDGVYVEISEEYIQLLGNYGEEGSFFLTANFSGDLFDYDLGTDTLWL